MSIRPLGAPTEHYVTLPRVLRLVALAILRFTPGDLFTDDLPRADVPVMGLILHDWDLPTKRMLISKAHAALDEGGPLIIYEFLIDDARRTHLSGLLMSLNMLIETRGGAGQLSAHMTHQQFKTPQPAKATRRAAEGVDSDSV
jgi:hypothetical protein